MSNQASNADKENSMIKERRSIKECLSPETQQCVDLLMVGIVRIVLIARE